MRAAFPFILVGALLVGCGSSSSTSTTTSTGTAAAAPTVKSTGSARVEKIPTAKAIVFPTVTAVPDSAYTATLYGTVTDAKTGSPVPGAVVKVGLSAGHETVTNSFGKYKVSFPGGAAVPVLVSVQGYASPPAMGRLAPHASYRLDFKLAPEKAGKPVVPPPPLVFGNH